MAHRHATKYAKNYCNQTPIVKVIVENVVTCFLGTQCRKTALCFSRSIVRVVVDSWAFLLIVENEICRLVSLKRPDGFVTAQFRPTVAV